MEDREFIDELMCHILDGANIPKVQVERAIGPILSMFMESILDKYFEDDDDYSGEYKLISPEFPLKKDNNQSTNIDYLLVNKSKRVLVFFELKTDVGSIGAEQMDIYVDFKKRIADNTCKILREDLENISRASKGSKYEYIISHFDTVIGSDTDIRKSIIVYLVPLAKVDKVKEESDVDFVLAFKDLPSTINHKFAQYWSIMHKNLLKIDDHFKKTNTELSDDPMISIIANIKNLSKSNSIQPISFQIGIMGEGKTPNYQVKFEDNSVRTFRFNGKQHSVSIFKQNNLSKEYLWSNYQDEV